MLKLNACEQEVQWHESEVQGEASDGGDGRPGMYRRPSRAEMGTVNNCELSEELEAR